MTRMRTGVAAAAAAAFVLFAFAPGAEAADAPSVSIDAPGEGAVLTGPSVTISGRASMHPLAGVETNRVTRVSVTLASSDHAGPLPRCDSCGGGEGFSVPFSWTTPALAYNGTYQATVVARGLEAVDVNGEESTTVTRRFRLAVPPAAPRNLKPVVNPDRTVGLSWAANAEPDLIGFRVQRKDPGSDSFTDAGGLVTQSSTGVPSLHDPVPAQGGGGVYTYRVQAIRAGPDSPVASAFVDGDAPVPTPDGRPAPAGGAAAGAGGAGAAGPVAPGAPPDLAGFLSGAGPKALNPSLPALPTAADTGFDPNLPYGKRRPSGLRSVALGAADLVSDPRALAVPVAAGLVLLVASFHLRFLSRRLAGADSTGTSVGAENT